MTVSFSTHWHEASWSAKGHVFKENEEQLILEMVMHSNNYEVRRYAVSDAGAVYVIAGVHVSPSDKEEHVTVRLGMNSKPWSNKEYPAYTAHIYWHNTYINVNPFSQYRTKLYNGHGKFSTLNTVYA